MQGFAGFRISKSFQGLKQKIKEWNSEVFGKVDVSRDAHSLKVAEWD